MPRHAVVMRLAVITWIQKSMAVVDGHRMICPTIIGAVHPPETETEKVDHETVEMEGDDMMSEGQDRVLLVEEGGVTEGEAVVVVGHRMICPTIIGAVHPPETEKEAVVVMIDEVEEGTRGVEAEIITEVGVDQAAADRGVDQGPMRGITIDVVGAEVAVGIVG